MLKPPKALFVVRGGAGPTNAEAKETLLLMGCGCARVCVSGLPLLAGFQAEKWGVAAASSDFAAADRLGKKAPPAAGWKAPKLACCSALLLRLPHALVVRARHCGIAACKGSTGM